MSLEPGASLQHYELLERLGAGGMGEVFRARDRRLGRDVALKLLPRELAGDAGRLARFEREARLLASLQHPEIATIHAFEPESDPPFLVMELVEGEDLAESLRQGPVPEEQALDLLVGIARGLAAAHEGGVVHRDLKPANVRVTPDGTVKLVDFGIARRSRSEGVDETSAATPDPGLTRTGTLVGTAPYMSPEQAQGQDVDARSDVWSFGCLAFELLSGERAFSGSSSMETLVAILRDEPDWSALPETVPGSLRELLRACLRKNAGERLPDMQSALETLNALRDSVTTAGAATTAAGNGDPLVEGREAYAARDWQRAWEGLRAADRQQALAAEDLERLAWTARWSGHYEAVPELLGRAEKAYGDEEDPRGAARMACFLAFHHHDQLNGALAAGCLMRAARLTAEEPGCAEQALVLWLRSYAEGFEGKIEESLGAARQSLTIAREAGDPDLESLARAAIGHGLLARGDVDEGRRYLDDAGAAAASGELGPFASGLIYCTVISAYRNLADWERAAEWTEAVNRWCNETSTGYFPGICRVHRAEVLRFRGSYDEAEKDALEGRDLLEVASPFAAGYAQQELAEIALRRGRFEEVEASCQRAVDSGVDPQPTLAQLRLSQGKPQAALRGLERTLQDTGFDSRERHVQLLPVVVTAALAAGEEERAVEALEELEPLVEELSTTAPRAAMESARGELELHRGDAGSASSHLRTARRLWCEIEAPYEAARSQVLLARAYELEGDESAAKMELDSARGCFERLGAEPDRVFVAQRLQSLDG